MGQKYSGFFVFHGNDHYLTKRKDEYLEVRKGQWQRMGNKEVKMMWNSLEIHGFSPLCFSFEGMSWWSLYLMTIQIPNYFPGESGEPL